MTKTLKDDINMLKKASLYFEVVAIEKDTTPRLDTYFGGKPFITDEKEIHECPACKKNMEFIFQLLMPVKRTNAKKLYAFYYCFDCVQDNYEGSYAVNIYANPSEEKMLKEYDYQSIVPYSDVNFLPAYEVPEWEYCRQSHPDFIRKMEALYGEKAFDTYVQLEQRVKEYATDTGYKLKGYPNYIDFDDIPRCPKSKQLMEPLIQMESIPELNMNWLGRDSYLILFKSPLYDEFELRTVDFRDFDGEDVFEDIDDEDDIADF